MFNRIKRLVSSKRTLYYEDGTILCEGESSSKTRFIFKTNNNKTNPCFLLRVAFRPKATNGVIRTFRNKTVPLKEYYNDLLNREIPSSLKKYENIPARLQLVEVEDGEDDEMLGFIHLEKRKDIIIIVRDELTQLIKTTIEKNKISTKRVLNNAHRRIQPAVKGLSLATRVGAGFASP